MDFSQQVGEANCDANQELNRQVGVEFEYCLDDILASANFEPDPRDAHAAASARAAGGIGSAVANGNVNGAGRRPAVQTANGSSNSNGLTNINCVGESAAARTPSLQEAADALRNEPPADRRKRRRALISAPVRVRGINVTDAVVDEISTTIDVSRAGILFLSTSPNYARGMEVAVMFPYSNAPAALHAEQQGRIVRAFGNDRWTLRRGRRAGRRHRRRYCRFVRPQNCGLIVRAAYAARTAGCSASSNGSVFSLSREPNSKRPLVLVVDADEMIRATLKGYLGERRLRSDGREQLPRRARSDEYVHARARDCGSGRRRPARL